jgi:hypothetical protein
MFYSFLYVLVTVGFLIAQCCWFQKVYSCVLSDIHDLIPFQNAIFINFRPLFSRLGHMHFYLWGRYAAFHGMTLTSHINGSMISALWHVSGWFHQFILNVEIRLSRFWGRVGSSLGILLFSILWVFMLQIQTLL